MLKRLTSIKSFVTSKLNLFEKVASTESHKISVNTQQYIMLNYKKIFKTIIEYVEGYQDIYDNEPDKAKLYGDKVIGTTKKYFDSMFTDESFKVSLDLRKVQSVFTDFLEGSKLLQNKLDMLSRPDIINGNRQLEQILIICDNQYKKISKVCKDDMNIYLYLMTKDTDCPTANISMELLKTHKDSSTPVIHTCSVEDASEINHI